LALPREAEALSLGAFLEDEDIVPPEAQPRPRWAPGEAERAFIVSAGEGRRGGGGIGSEER